MKLRNKQTGEILESARSSAVIKDKFRIYDELNDKYYAYNSLAELNEEWEDAPEEPKGIQCIYYVNHFDAAKIDGVIVGFESKEEAEKAVEKLKAWKRLKDKGFKLEGWTIDDGLRVSVCTNFDSDGIYDEDRKEVKKDLDICFGGEE